ncbi:uncharacterized protein BKA78DRAFT_377584 [Phyllosticta capitalensis]|uniref:uncharacterized protein n=1 Tax=Phyllosticta capitalensis TaxID=121624 RepID=UPI00312F4BB0
MTSKGYGHMAPHDSGPKTQAEWSKWAIIETSVAEARAIFQPAPFYCTAKAARRDIRSQLDREPSFTFPRVSKLHHDSVQFLVKRLEERMVAEGVIKVLEYKDSLEFVHTQLDNLLKSSGPEGPDLDDVASIQKQLNKIYEHHLGVANTFGPRKAQSSRSLRAEAAPFELPKSDDAKGPAPANNDTQAQPLA